MVKSWLPRIKNSVSHNCWHSARKYNKGGKYIDLKKVFFIAISNCNLFPDKPDYISSHTIRDEKTNEHDLKDFQFIFIELPKFPKSREEQIENVVDRWLFFFKYAEETTDEDLRKIAEKSPIIKLAYDELDRFRWNEKDLVAYEERIMDLRKGEAILAQKLDDAREEGKIEVAKAMLANNVDIDTIVKCTGLSISEIKELQEVWKC